MSIESRIRQQGKAFDHWQIREFLGSGSGGKSAVFRLVHSSSGSVKSALKVISLIEKRSDYESLSVSRKSEYEQVKQKCKEYAEQEVLLMNDLQGRTNIVDYLDHTFVDWVDEAGFGCDMLIRMELLRDLRREIEKEHVFSQEEILRIGREICSALVLCHSKNILHRDIKPENIFINKDGNYKLGDFGISRILSSAPLSKASTGNCTPEYAAPEQMSGRYDTRVDIYSLGLVLYELSNNNLLPFATSSYITEIEVQERLLGKPLPAPRNASKALAAVILKACAFNPDDRYQTAEEFLGELNYIAGVGPRPVTKNTSTKRETKKAAPAVGGNATQYAKPDAHRKEGSINTENVDPGMAEHTSRRAVRNDKARIPKAAIIGIVLILLLGIGISAFWGLSAAADRAAIKDIMSEADVLADVNNFDDAIAKVQASLQEHPNSDDLSSKLDEITRLQTDFEINQILAEAEKMASAEDFEAAIDKLEAGLVTHPESNSLRDKVLEYTNALTEAIRAQTLADAKALADIGEYETAMSMIEAAQKSYGSNKDYQDAYASYHKAHSLAAAKVYVDAGDYPNAINLLENAQKINANDVELITAYNSYCDSYVANVLNNADILLADRNMDEAITKVNNALKVLPSHPKLKQKKEELLAAKPIPITTLLAVNSNGWREWNSGSPIDPFGNDYSHSCNYVILEGYSLGISSNMDHYTEYRLYGNYSNLTGTIATHIDSPEGRINRLQIYTDDKLVYTSPDLGRKTDAIDFSVDVSDVEYVKIVVFTESRAHAILSDVQLWP